MIHERLSSHVPMAVKMVGAVLVGLGIGTVLFPSPVGVPLVGPIPGLVAGAMGILAGGGMYLRGPELFGVDGGSASCGCVGDCGCS